MTDRHILFSAPMVLALNNDLKTQSRRVLTQLLRFGKIREFGPSDTKGYDWHFRDKDGRWHDLRHAELLRYLPYSIGDRLWVREAWRAQEVFDDMSPAEIGEEFKAEHGEPWCPTFYEADKRCDGSSIDIWQQSPPGRLRASMHMPRWSSRLTLTVTDIRIQRLQDIDDIDAHDEGIDTTEPVPGIETFANGAWLPGAMRERYRHLWDGLNDDRGYGWDANPWVIAITFTVARRNIDEAQP